MICGSDGVLLQGWHLYHRFIQVMGVSDTFWRYALFGWGVPFIFVTVGAAMFEEDYGTDELCYIDTNSSAVYLVIVPIGTAITVNIWFFQKVLRVIFKHVAEKDDGSGWAHVKVPVLTASGVFGAGADRGCGHGVAGHAPGRHDVCIYSRAVLRICTTGVHHPRSCV